jgi:hypothetical protein
MKIQTTTIQFPEIKLRTRDSHKLRGFFGNLFKEHSDLLHNHYNDGSSKYKYPLVQYKVLNKIPSLVGIEEGGRLLIELFLKFKHITIEGSTYEVNSKNITNNITEIGDFSKLREYKFETLWMGLNQKNYPKYMQLESQTEKNDFLNKQLQNNILSFYTGVDFFAKDRIMATAKVHEKSTQFKNKTMTVFNGSFVTNAILPDFVGIGKSTSRGFGTVVSLNLKS